MDATPAPFVGQRNADILTAFRELTTEHAANLERTRAIAAASARVEAIRECIALAEVIAASGDRDAEIGAVRCARFLNNLHADAMRGLTHLLYPLPPVVTP
jgi:hypothetical protein